MHVCRLACIHFESRYYFTLGLTATFKAKPLYSITLHMQIEINSELKHLFCLLLFPRNQDDGLHENTIVMVSLKEFGGTKSICNFVVAHLYL